MRAGIYVFSEPFQTRYQEILKGINIPDRSRAEDDKKVYAERAMQSKPASEKQIALLKRLGYGLEMPKSMREASLLIDSLLHK